MKKFIFYTNDGFTQDINAKEIDNCQILGESSGENLEDAILNFKKEYSYLSEYQYTNILVIQVLGKPIAI